MSTQPQSSRAGHCRKVRPSAPSWRRINLPWILLIRGYQITLGPFMGGHCRFTPTCSRYALDAFSTLPPHRAAWATLRRLLRCHPWGGQGYDPAPAAQTRKSGKIH